MINPEFGISSSLIYSTPDANDFSTSHGSTGNCLSIHISAKSCEPRQFKCIDSPDLSCQTTDAPLVSEVHSQSRHNRATLRFIQSFDEPNDTWETTYNSPHLFINTGEVVVWLNAVCLRSGQSGITPPRVQTLLQKSDGIVGIDWW